MTDHASSTMEPSHLRGLHKYAAWTNVVCGFLVFVSRYASPRPSFEVHRNLFLTGILITFAAFADVIAHDGDSTTNYWSAINVAAGIWLLIASKAIPAVASVTLAEQILGAVIIVVALASLAIEIASQRM